MGGLKEEEPAGDAERGEGADDPFEDGAGESGIDGGAPGSGERHWMQVTAGGWESVLSIQRKRRGFPAPFSLRSPSREAQVTEG